jgi:adenylate cyclase
MPHRAVIDWLLTHGRVCASAPALLQGLGEQLAACTSVERVWMGTKVLHPQAAAFLWIWERDRPIIERSLSYALFARMDQGDSPVKRLRVGPDFLRLRAPEGAEMPDLMPLWDQGYVELIGLSVHFKGVWAGGLTYASRVGFSDAEVELLQRIQPVLSAVLEPRASDLVTRTLLRTYLGNNAGEQVFQGQVKRGDGSTVRAVVWFSDIRGFTRLSESLDRDALLSLLNLGFEHVVDAVEAHGGEVLKFMGDGALAVFPCDQGDAAACASARAAALDLGRRLADHDTLAMGVGLHLGEVSYGNIGAPGRLDFTVIGPAVNLAARVEGQCSVHDAEVLCTEQVAAHGGWRCIGSAQLKGVAEPVGLFAPTP